MTSAAMPSQSPSELTATAPDAGVGDEVEELGQGHPEHVLEGRHLGRGLARPCCASRPADGGRQRGAQLARLDVELGVSREAARQVGLADGHAGCLLARRDDGLERSGDRASA